MSTQIRLFRLFRLCHQAERPKTIAGPGGPFGVKANRFASKPTPPYAQFCTKLLENT
jgi:hypothetical protein